MLKGKFRNSYRSKNGTPTFVFRVSGDDEAIKAYEESQGVHLRPDNDTGEPLWFTTRFPGKSVNLIFTEAGDVIADNSELDQINSLAETYPHLADALAKQAMAKLGIGASTAPVARQEQEVEEKEEAEGDLGDM